MFRLNGVVLVDCEQAGYVLVFLVLCLPVVYALRACRDVGALFSLPPGVFLTANWLAAILHLS